MGEAIEAGKRKGTVFPRTFRKNCSPADTLTLAQRDPCGTSNLQNCKVIHVCCFKPKNKTENMEMEHSATPIAPELSLCQHTRQAARKRLS